LYPLDYYRLVEGFCTVSNVTLVFPPRVFHVRLVCPSLLSVVDHLLVVLAIPGLHLSCLIAHLPAQERKQFVISLAFVCIWVFYVLPHQGGLKALTVCCVILVLFKMDDNLVCPVWLV